MAGRARAKAIVDSLDARRRRHFDLTSFDQPDNDQTILDYLGEYIARGRTLKALAEELSTELQFEVWSSTLERVLEREYGKGAVSGVLRTSRARASHSYAEESKDLVDAADETSSSAISKANAQARSRQWLAEKFSPEAFGQRGGQSVTINVGQLHLGALRTASQNPNRVTGSESGSVPVLCGAESAVAQVVDSQDVTITDNG